MTGSVDEAVKKSSSTVPGRPSSTGTPGDIEDPPPGGEILHPGDYRRSGRRRWWPGAICCGLYLVLAMLAYGTGSIGPSHMTGTLSTDAIEEVWWLAWTAFALPHGHNVLAAQWQDYPAGENFGVNGSMLALGVFFMPITKLFGPVVAWNVALRLGVALSASSMCLVLRRWTTWWPAAFVGGLLYGFSAYMSYYGGNYLFLVFVPLPPLIFLLLHEILVRQRWRPGRTGALLGLVCALQFFIWSEILASTVVMGAIAVCLFLLVGRHHLAERWRYALKALAYSLGVSGVLLCFPLLYTLAGPQSINGSPQSAASIAEYPSDLFGAFVPSAEWLGTSHLTAIADDRFVYAMPLYLGLSLIVVLVSFAVFLHKRRAILFAGAMALISFVLSLGSRLWVDGHETTIRLPFVVLAHLPLIGGSIPARYSLYTTLFAAAMFAIGLDELWVRMRRSGRLASLTPRWRIVASASALAALTAVALIPLVPRHTQPSSQTKVASFFTSSDVDAVPVGSVVLGYPYPDGGLGLYFEPTHDIMLDQAFAGMRFKLIGGYGWFPSPTGVGGIANPPVLEPKVVRDIFDAAYYGNATARMWPLSLSNETALRVFLRKYDVKTVVVLAKGQSPGAVVSYVTAAIGSPAESGGVTVWSRVNERLRRHMVHVVPVTDGDDGAFPNLRTDVLTPANGVTVAGKVPLASTATGYFRLTSLDYYLSGPSHHHVLIGAASLTPFGWTILWNTKTVANGTYHIEAVAHDVAGRSSHGSGITVTVDNK